MAGVLANLASTISASFIIEGTPIYRYGTLAAAYSVGQFVYESAAGVFTIVDSDTAATLLSQPMCIGYKERILSTGAASTIDSPYATTDTGVPILIGFVDGEGIFVAKIEDPGGDLQRGNQFIAAATVAGDIKIQSAAELAAGDPNYRITNDEYVADTSTYMRARWGG